MKDNNCIFCKLANGDIPTTTIFEDEDFRVIPDAGPASFGHLLIIPKEHHQDLTELPEATAAKVLPLAARLGRAMKASLGCAGFNVVQNNGAAAGQTVMHFHVHLIPRYEAASLWWCGNPAPWSPKKHVKSRKKWERCSENR